MRQAGDPQRSAMAMRAVSELLVRPDEKLILLFTPPFDKSPREPGYIKGYLPSIRENGGQYTHSALWSAWAFSELGQGDYAESLFRMINPINHSDTPKKTEQYKVEPYVVAADVYSVPPHTGRGGWTWYTGSGGWMYRLGLEGILGIRLEGGSLRIDPCIPKNWSSYEIVYRKGETAYHIQVDNPSAVNGGVKEISLDGVLLPDGIIPIEEDGHEHKVSVRLGE